MQSGKEENYWPGFVDALSNVVLTLVFVLVVFVFALVLASSKVTQKAQELADNAQKKATEQIQSNQETIRLKHDLEEAIQKLEESQQSNQKLQSEISRLKRQQAAAVETHKPAPAEDPKPVPEVAEERNALTEQIQVSVDKAPERTASPDRDDSPLIDQGTGVIVVVFPRGVFEINDAAKAELTRTLSPQKGRLSGMTITLKSVMGVESYSEAQRLAYYRGLSIRNYMMENGYGSGQTIKVLIEPAKEVGDARVEIRFNSR